MSVSGESDSWAAVFGFCLSVSVESDSWAAVFGFCLSVSVESDKHAPVLGLFVRFCRIGHMRTGDGGLGGLGCGLGCHRRGYGCRIGVQRFDGTVDHFVDAAFDGDFHAVLFGGKRLKNGELAW